MRRLLAMALLLRVSLEATGADTKLGDSLSSEQLNALPQELAESYTKNRIEQTKKFQVCDSNWTYEQRIRSSVLKVKRNSKARQSVDQRLVDLDDIAVDSVVALSCASQPLKWVLMNGHFGLHSRVMQVYSVDENSTQPQVTLKTEIRGYSFCRSELVGEVLTLTCDRDPQSKNPTNQMVEMKLNGIKK
jgi:hypothetical protein